MDALRAERLDRERGGQRGVDPARDADQDLAEAVLVDVVTQPELQGEAHLLELAELGGQRASGVLAVLSHRADVDDGRFRRRGALAGHRPAAEVAQASPDRLARLDVDDEQLLVEAASACNHVPVLVEHERVAVEDQLVLAAHGVAEGHEARVVAGARGEHLLALSVAAEVERRGRDVGDQLRAGQRKIGRRWAGLPEVLADRRPDQGVA